MRFMETFTELKCCVILKTLGRNIVLILPARSEVTVTERSLLLLYRKKTGNYKKHNMWTPSLLNLPTVVISAAKNILEPTRLVCIQATYYQRNNNKTL